MQSERKVKQMPVETSNALKIAVIEEQIKNINKNLEHISDNFDRMSTKLDELTAAMNRGKGAYAASLAIAGAIGAGAMSLITMVSAWAHK